MSKLKLDSIGYFEPFNADDLNSLKLFVYWLESEKIRFFPPEERTVLNVLKDDESWNNSFQKYLNDLGLKSDGPKAEIVDGLLNLALELEMEDIQKELNVSDADIAALGIEKAHKMSQIDIKSHEFLKNLQQLSQILRVPFYCEEPLITLRAIAILLRQLKYKTEGSYSSKDNSTSVHTDILEASFFKNRPASPELNRAFNLLRLLYVSDLRNLQNTINSIIVQIQTLTANPKTDSSLGQVGI